MPEIQGVTTILVRIGISLGGWWVATLLAGALLGRFLRRFEESSGQDFAQGGLANGGYWIGIGERTLIYLFILSGVPEGIGFLVAAKSIFRFGEIKEPDQRELAEYILIGTLMSFTAATLVGFATKYVLGLID
ncbi:MAG: hypothetical protein PVG42_02415 [Lysobacterales bacterium]|jgi:hypothetical protein